MIVPASLRDAYGLLPDGLRRAILVRRRSPVWIDAGIVFIHIPKAAGTSINQVLYGRFMGHMRVVDVRRWAPAAVKSLPSFAITRNPWDRLVSAYRFAIRGTGVGRGIQAAIQQPKQYRIPEFDCFDTFVTEWLSRRDVAKLDYVFQPQSLFVCDKAGRVAVDHLGRIENLGPTLDFVSRTIGRPLKLPVSNRSGAAIDYRDYYTPELSALVGRIYAEDVSRFGYSFGD